VGLRGPSSVPNQGFKALAVAAFVLVASPALAQQQTSQPSAPVYPIAPTRIPSPGTPPWMNTWIGGGITNSFQGGFAGFTTATNPQRSLWIDGWLVRMDFVGGKYSSINGVTGNDDSVETHGADFLIGYRKALPNSSLALYVGPAYEFHNNSDPTVKIRGGEGGVKGLFEHWWQIAPDWTLSSGASYSMAFSTYYAYSQLAYRLSPHFELGPEVSLFGNEAPYRELRAGAFVRFDTAIGQVTVGGGYRDPLTTGSTGYYISFMLGNNFY
jgi:hypothetical protein